MLSESRPPFSCYSKENYIVKYPLLPLSGFPYRITQCILKFPILIILISSLLIHSYIKLREYVHKNTNGAMDKHKKTPKFIWHNNLLFYPAFVYAKSEIFFIHLLIIISSRNFSVRLLPLFITKYTLLNHKKAK